MATTATDASDVMENRRETAPTFVGVLDHAQRGDKIRDAADPRRERQKMQRLGREKRRRRLRPARSMGDADMRAHEQQRQCRERPPSKPAGRAHGKSERQRRAR